jgi:NAD(P)H-hydrate epimerase
MSTVSSDTPFRISQPDDSSARYLDENYVARLAPVRPKDGHKGTFGRILIWAGSEGMAGAAYLCAMAALRSGVGLVHLMVPEDLMMPMFLSIPQAITHKIPQTPEGIIRVLASLLPTVDACVVGPGLPTHDPSVTEGLVYAAKNAKNLIVDAGAITVIAGAQNVFIDVLSGRLEDGLAPAIFTPHPGEFLRLVPDWDTSNRISGASDFAVTWRVVTVLKGHQTVICTPDHVCYLNSTGNDGLAKGGSGDVLCGMIGSFCAQGLPPADAACAGTFLHGMSGDFAASALGKRYMQPTDLFSFFTEAFSHCRWE